MYSYVVCEAEYVPLHWLKDILLAKMRLNVVPLTNDLLSLPRLYARDIKGMSLRVDNDIPAGLIKRPCEG